MQRDQALAYSPSVAAPCLEIAKVRLAAHMRDPLTLIKQRAPELENEGEMHGDAALIESIRRDLMPDSSLKGTANLLIMPNVEAAHTSYNMLRVSCSEGMTVGLVLKGIPKPVIS